MSEQTFNARRSLSVGGNDYQYYALEAVAEAGFGTIDRLPFTLKVLLENLLRFEDGETVTRADVAALVGWLKEQRSDHEIAFRPARVLMQDFTGVPAVVDLAAMRDAVRRAGGDPQRINPRIPVDLIIDHSVMVDKYAMPEAFAYNVKREMERNRERYMFLRWGQMAFDNFRVVPPGTGICHQVNLEYLGRTVWSEERDGVRFAYPDTLVGTDSHTTMINGLAVLGWGVGGIEAEAAMLGQPISMLIPAVVGFRFTGALREGVTATDLVLTVTEQLREFGVVGKFVEFFGEGLSRLSLADRATIGNMSPEYGATCGFFPVDQVTLDYLRLTGRPDETLALVEAYAKQQGMWRSDDGPDPLYSDVLELDLATVQPSLAGPKRPQDRVNLVDLRKATEQAIPAGEEDKQAPATNAEYRLKQGDVVIAAITSCTNTSNPAVMMGAGLVAKKAVEKGLQQKPWVKTSLAPGSKVVTDYLEKAGLQTFLDQLGFNVVGYGCTTCIGNSGPLAGPIAEAIEAGDLTVCSVLSGNRNFEGRIHSQTRANWLASPPLVVAFALAGTTRIDLDREPLGEDRDGNPVYLKDIWPSDAEVAELVKMVSAGMFREKYADVFSGEASWRELPVPEGETYAWDPQSTYVREPSFFELRETAPPGLKGFSGARLLAKLGDSITTDHISPAGAILASTPAGIYLREHGVEPVEFNSYGSRRGNHEVMVRGTFANLRLRNELAPGTEGGFSIGPDGEVTTLFEAAMAYQQAGTPLLIVAGREYGTGSSRDWAAKGTLLLGVKAVIAESYERIHRSNLIGMGILPLQFKDGVNRETLGLDGSESFDLPDQTAPLEPGQELIIVIHRADGRSEDVPVLCRLDTQNEIRYYSNGGILNYVLQRIVKN
ncbi:aconitate hydratase AcnA [Geothermobacter hydrogeniphilus]|uniref:Aconitate hydratase n=1 Tax=Geothermobacter hydrogeniphilus TaxID=1969733 RepID=A0A2K2H638_9BACT|nr:aconitate hydratase AcnA [Geothermobacter hydrogeniphilus]PNU18768.1 aconitate hydratase AcnA [Geothermobacter hydrogeniphilus]